MKNKQAAAPSATADPEKPPAAEAKPRAKRQRQKRAAAEAVSEAMPEQTASSDKPPGKPSGKPRRTAPSEKSRAKKSGPAKKTAGKKKGRKNNGPHPSRHFVLAALVVEITALLCVGLAATVAALGYAAMRFSGLALATNLLPFAAMILALIVACALLLTLWFFLRRWLLRRHPSLAAIVALLLLAACGWAVREPRFFAIYDQFRIMVGGKEEVARRQLAHQVYAAYRRITPADAQAMLAREKLYHDDIAAASTACGLDADLLSGVAAVESSFLPRASADGGDGLFQITSVPKAATAVVDRLMAAANTAAASGEENGSSQRRNALLGAATLAHYIRAMDNDVFLGLLAYNIGPKNGGLRSIMEQYGARDFVTIQPYLQYLPRDYPIKVFAWALLFRVARETGGPLPYQDGTNAARIQTIGIPGFDRR